MDSKNRVDSNESQDSVAKDSDDASDSVATANTSRQARVAEINKALHGTDPNTELRRTLAGRGERLELFCPRYHTECVSLEVLSDNERAFLPEDFCEHDQNGESRCSRGVCALCDRCAMAGPSEESADGQLPDRAFTVPTKAGPHRRGTEQGTSYATAREARAAVFRLLEVYQAAALNAATLAELGEMADTVITAMASVVSACVEYTEKSEIANKELRAMLVQSLSVRVGN